MVIVGAKGHAKDVLSVLEQSAIDFPLAFYDDLSTDLPETLFGKYPILKTKEQAREFFKQDNRFVLGVGAPRWRRQLTERMMSLGGALHSVISPTATIGKREVTLGPGLNIMSQVVITNHVSIGEGSLINTHVSVHHDSIVGKYCEISPGARVSGGAIIGDFCSVGLNAVLLPKIKIGNNVIVGAGCVVNKDVGDNVVVAGVPAKVIRQLEPIQL